MAAPKPVIRLSLAAEEFGAKADSADGVALERRLEDVLPEMTSVTVAIRSGDSANKRESPQAEPDDDREAPTAGERSNASYAALVARAALAFQREFGFDVRSGEVTRHDDGLDQVYYEHRDPTFALLAGSAAVSLVSFALRESHADLGKIRDRLLEQLRTQCLAVLNRYLICEAERRGIPWRRLHPTENCVQFVEGHKQRRFLNAFTDRTPYIATKLATSKQLTGDLLRANAIPSPRQIAVASADHAVAAARTLGYPVVVKPNAGDMAHGVSINLTTERAVREAFDEARKFGPVLVENHVPGKSHRVTVINGRMVSAIGYDPPKVAGDGSSTIAQLIEIANSDPRSGTRDFDVLHRIIVDDDLLETLGAQGLDLDHVPDAGVVVPLRRWWRGGKDYYCENMTDRVHPENRILAERAARLIGLDIAGIDFVTPDISRPCTEVGGVINEVNPTPGFMGHLQAGISMIVGRYFDTGFTSGDDGRIPVAAICGPADGSAIARRAAALLTASGHVTGMADTVGVEVARERIARGDFANVAGANMTLADPRTTAAVLHLTPEALAADGLGLDKVTVAAILAAVEDGAIARLLADNATGLIVLDVDNPLGPEFADRYDATRVCLVSGDPDAASVRRHVEQGGLAVTPGDTEGNGATALWIDREPIGLNIPTAPDEDKSKDNPIAALFAAAVAYGLGVPPEAMMGGRDPG